MKNKYITKYTFFCAILLCFAQIFHAQVTLEKEVKISDIALHFDGNKVDSNASNTGDNAPYDYFFGNSISAKGYLNLFFLLSISS